MQDVLNLVIVGHVDHGKSTLIGRLLHEVGALPAGKLEAAEAASRRRGVAFEWAFMLDALQLERDQGLTVAASHIGFTVGKRRYAIIDAPGHREFLKHMITGAAHADAALLVVDAKEGMREQTRRHAHLLPLLGIRQVAVVVNKMDAAEKPEEAFKRLSQDIVSYMERIGLAPSHIIPVSARDGDNVTAASARMPFYKGPTVLSALAAFQPAGLPENLPLRLAVQDVYKFDERRIIAGRIESGTLAVGDTLLFSPSNARAKVTGIEAWPEARVPKTAGAGECVGITLDQPVFVERGQVASHEDRPPMLTPMFRASVFWLGAAPLRREKRYRVKIGTAEMPAEVREIISVVNPDTLEQGKSEHVESGAAAEVIFRVRGLAAVDDAGTNPRSGRFVILDGHAIAGGGTISLEGFSDQRAAAATVKSENISSFAQGISLKQRAISNGHLPGILWFTGLSGAGKSTLAQGLQKALFAKGCQVFVLDGDNIRKGLSSDLGFSVADRQENLRRAGEVAALFAQSGAIVITAFISPTHADRALARACAPEYFHTVHIKADLATCEKRDAKGLYKKARAGQITDFTGISAPYEAPAHADVVVDTANGNVRECVRQLVHYVEQQFIQSLKGEA